MSDFHARIADKEKLEDRVQALFDDLDRQSISPDLLFFTGDVAYNGKAEEYKLAQTILFGPLVRRLQLNPRKVFVVDPNAAIRWRRAVFASLMPMPEAAVDEDHGFVFWQDDVRAAGQFAVVQAEAIAHPVEH